MTAFFIFLLGIVAGSFLNVCIWRIPRRESIVSPGSHCPQCRKPVAWRDNIPLLSYLLLLGKCRHCKIRISPRYFLVELLSGILWVLMWRYYGFSSGMGAGILFLSFLLMMSVTDLETGLIPDWLSLPGIGLGLAVSAVFPALHEREIWYLGLGQSFLGAAVGGGLLIIVAIIGDWMFKKESMGGGDVKLLAFIGAFLGAQKAVFVFFLSPFFALFFALYVKLIRKGETIPYGPFLAFPAAVCYVYGDQWIRFFLN